MSETIDIALDKLIEPYYNPRVHPQEQVYNLSLSLKEFGQRRTIAAWPVGDGTYEVLAGNGIKAAAVMAGWSKLSCTLAPQDMTIVQRKAYALADNQGGAVDDMTKVAQILEEVSADGRIALEALGSSQAGLDALLEDLANQALAGQEPGDGGDDYDTEPPRVATRVKLGDIWQLGRHVIGCLDSTDEAAIKRLIGNKKPAMIFADPPYGMNLDTNYSNRPLTEKAREKHPVQRDYAPVMGDSEDYNPSFLIDLFSNVKEQFWWGADYYRRYLPSGGSWLVWDKREGLEDVEYTTSEFELCWSRQMHHRDILRVRWFGLCGTENQDIKKRVHPTQKPIGVYSPVMEKYSNDGDFIFDPYLGSGTSIIAAERLNRTVYGCELSPEYIEVCIDRFEKETNQTAKLIERITND